MQGNSLTDNPKEAAEQQANFVMLRSLEQKIPSSMFDQVLQQVRQSCNMPKRLDWKGNVRDLSFEELKVNFSQVDQNYLPLLLESELTGLKHKSSKLNIKDGFQNKDVTKLANSFARPKNMMMRLKNMPYERMGEDTIKKFRYDEVSRFERMKTVFGHCLIDEGCHAPIYNVKYDQTDNFIISGADDCIIKIWDKNSMNLQASLHSHEDVITDIDISKCNRYLASASIDGKIIIWDWQNCKKLDEITDHRSNVNNIKFFSLQAKSSQDDSNSEEELQILVSCSEDGTVRIYDQIAYLEQLAASDSPVQGRRSRGRSQAGSGQQQQIQRERFCIVLQPSDFRAGARNKKINTVHISKNGIVAAGTDKGEILIWTIDIKAFVKSQTHRNINPSQIAHFIGSFKMFTKAVHFCEFSPNGFSLFAGSDDGTAKIWKIDKGKEIQLSNQNELVIFEEKRKPNRQDQGVLFTDSRGNLVSLDEHKDKKSKWDCDSIAWSANGRYAITAISGKFDEQSNHVYCFIKVWDSFTNELIQDIARGTTANLSNSTFVLSPHPTIEEIFMSGGDGGNICLWNIKDRQLIKKFLEYGIYSYEKYTMNDPKCGRFSNDGSSFVVGSGTGTLSLFACDGSNFKYSATRVEQFFPMDDVKHPQNIYYELEDGQEPQICGYSLIPYEVQPSSSIIGKFKNARQYTHEEYERNLVLRQHIVINYFQQLLQSKEEEDFLLGQLNEGLENNLFNPNNNGMEFEVAEDGDDDIRVRPRRAHQIINSQNTFNSSSSIEMIGQRNNGSNEERQLLNEIRLAERNAPRGGRRGIIQNRNVRNIMNGRGNRPILNPNFDPDNSLYDRESDENFVIPEASSIHEEEANELAELEQESSEDLSPRRGRAAGRRVNVVFEQNDPRRPPTRQTRRNHEEETKAIEVARRVRRQIRDESDPSQSVSVDQPDDTYEISDLDQGVQTRARGRPNRSESRRRQQQLLSSDDDSVDQDIEDTLEEMSSQMQIDEFSRNKRSRSQRLRKRKEASESKNKERKNKSSKRNLRSRGKRVNYRESESQSFQSEEDSEDQKMKSESEEEKVMSKSKSRKRAVVDESNDEQMIQEGEKDEENEFYLYEQNQVVQLEEQMIQQINPCYFCKRSDGAIIGPFGQAKDLHLASIKYYFHQDCLETNNITFYDKQKNKWKNIGKALEKLQKKPIMCDRCGHIGATIKCKDCRKQYHGYFCSSLFMIYIAQRQYQCFECRNRENYKQFSKSPGMDKQEYKHMKRALPREIILSAKQTKEYLPQIGDKVYYFFQGHEAFIELNNCFFYCGDNEELIFQYPWKQYMQLRQPTLCKIISVSFHFPSLNSMTLLKKFGRTMDIPQIPQILIKLTLHIDNDSSSIFELDYFPNVIPEFLVPKEIYEQSLLEFQRLMSVNSFINNVFQKRHGPKYRILAVKNYEDSVNEDTNWLTVLCQLEEQYRLRGRERRSAGRRDHNKFDQEALQKMNFWDFEFQIQPPPRLQVLDQNIRSIIMNSIQEQISKKSELCAPFMERVTEKLARDYKDHIAGEMYLTLISERVTNNYYRSIDQIYADLDQIYENSRIYNSEDSDLTQIAKKVSDGIKKAIKNNLSLIEFGQNDEETKINSIIEKPFKITINTGQVYKPYHATSHISKSIMQTTNLMNGGEGGKLVTDDDLGFENADLLGKTGKLYPQYQEEVKIHEIPTLNRMLNHNVDHSTEFSTSHVKQRQNQPTQEKRVTRRTPAEQVQPSSSNSKIVIKVADSKEGDDKLLGKATKSGRNRKVAKANLKEDSDSDCQDIDQDDQQVSMKGPKKRPRNA